MISIKLAREKLGESGKNMTDQEIEKLLNNLYALIGMIIDNNISSFKPCKKR